ncbi:MAG: helix-turn-helix domain-containing protein [Clostridiales bacterium]|nr:helix-turn-helix domain-containing protein [Clostridiales bacterium]
MKIRVQKTHNYTVMSNYHLQDRRLSYKAKGLLSFMLSVSDNWEYTIKGLATMSKDGVDSVATALKELEGCGYVDRRRNRNEKGQVTDTEYIVYEMPIDKTSEPVLSETKSCKKAELEALENQSEPKRENPEQAENSQTRDTQPKTDFPRQAETVCEDCSSDDYTSNNPKWENLVQDNPVLANPILDNPVLEKPVQENPAQINKNIKNKKEINTKRINTQLFSSHNSLDRYEREETSEYTPAYRISDEEYRDYKDSVAEVKENLSYDDVLKVKCSIDELSKVDKMIEIIAQTMLCNDRLIRVGGRDLPSAVVKQRLSDLNCDDILYVLGRLKNANTEPRNVWSYLLTALYNAPYDSSFLRSDLADTLQTDSSDGSDYDETDLENLVLELMRKEELDL